MLAYKRTPAGDYGDHDSAKSFALDTPANEAPRGMWSDRATIWVVDRAKDQLFAYDLKTGGRRPTSDITLLDAHSEPRGVWGADDTLWVVNDDDGASKVFAYYPPQLGPRVSEISITSATRTSATVRVATSSLDSTGRVYLRFRNLFDDTWSAVSNMPAAATVDFTLLGLPPGGYVAIQASLDDTLSDGTEFRAVLRVRPAQRDFVLTDGEDVRGLWSDGTTLWAVIDGSRSDRVDAYSLGGQARPPTSPGPLPVRSSLSNTTYRRSKSPPPAHLLRGFLEVGHVPRHPRVEVIANGVPEASRFLDPRPRLQQCTYRGCAAGLR